MSSASPTESRKTLARGLAIIVFVILLACLSVALIQPPAPVPEDAPATEFSSARAMKRLRVIAQKPHPTGSEENARVREYILGELASLGVSAEVQRATVLQRSRRRDSPAQAATVHNVVARVEGEDEGDGGALMLAAHYDSVPTGPGANDDGAGVATILETLRALKSGPPLRNDLILLFTDAEELGLVGARAFADEHPWMRDVRLVLNFEGRGRGGPSFMFETSEGNGPLISEFASTAPRPVANSLMYALYEHLPNDTDLTVFKRAGAAGLNFAYVDDITRYHTALDTPEQTDERSIQHHGSQALALARHFGNGDLNLSRGRDAVYFNAAGPLFVRYSQVWVIPLAVLVLVVAACVVVAGWRRRLLTPGGMVFAFLIAAACAVAAVLIGFVGRGLIAWLHPGYRYLPWGAPYNSRTFELALVALVLFFCATLYTLARRRASAENLAAGALCLWLVLLVASTLLLPAGSFLFTWPLLFALGWLAYMLIARDDAQSSWKGLAVAAVTSAPAVLLVAPVVYMFFVLLGTEMPVPALFFVALLAVIILPHVSLGSAWRVWLLPAALLALGVALFVTGLATARFDSGRRKTNSIFYELNADTGRARWVGPEVATDEWTSQFLTPRAKRDVAASIFPWEAGTLLTDEAQAITDPPPALELLADGESDGVRKLTLRVTSLRGASFMQIYTDVGTEVYGALVNGKGAVGDDVPQAGEPRNYLRVFYWAPPAEGVVLQLDVNPARPLKLNVSDGTFGLPDFEEFKPRPADMMPRPSKLGDVTLVRKSFTIDAPRR